MDWQWIANGLFTIVGLLLGLIVNATRESVKDLHKQDTLLAEKVQTIEVLVIGNYAKKDDLDKLMAALFAKLDKIENKLDGKADKPHGNFL